MKVLFLKDVKNVGQRGVVKEVSDGYALNSLIPSGQAVQATQERIKEYEMKRAQEAAVSDTRSVMAKALLKQLDGKTFTVHAEVNEKGKLYKKVPLSEIVEAISKELSLEVPEAAVSSKTNIHEVGEHMVELTLEKATAKIIIRVTK